ncbi:Ribosome maturation factor RimP [bioreactor metagenome]|uniref:Ribosome maturation factor RimP n=1 Tax=bioreactor metagenome TaxID=1076179 RepID=A0A645BB54_9ZZZZ|nr:ribosome maturation factor RimP [Oscillospiraceae bacterium]
MSQKQTQHSVRIADTVKALIKDKISSLGYILWDVEYYKEGAYYNLTVTIDSPEGISLSDCEKVTKQIDPILDENDPVPDSYYLEVSSAGLERELKTDDHIRAYIGKEIKLGFFTALESGDKSISGILNGYRDEELSVTIDAGLNKSAETGCDKKELRILKRSCAYIRSVYNENEANAEIIERNDKQNDQQ